MSTVELRNSIIEQLSQIEDVSFLNALRTIIASKVSDNVYELSDFQKERIKLGRQQIKDGQTISNEDLQKEIDQWLNSK
jgi:predicted transcriptional regulator